MLPALAARLKPVNTEGSGAGTWIVWRQDDHGNRAEVARFIFQDEADELCKTMEARGHKQLYWVSPA